MQTKSSNINYFECTDIGYWNVNHKKIGMYWNLTKHKLVKPFIDFSCIQ